MNCPYVLLNMAMSADAKIATANRMVASFGSARDQIHLLELRATADAVMCGSRTANTPGVTLGPGGIVSNDCASAAGSTSSIFASSSVARPG